MSFYRISFISARTDERSHIHYEEKFESYECNLCLIKEKVLSLFFQSPSDTIRLRMKKIKNLLYNFKPFNVETKIGGETWIFQNDE